MAHIGAFDLASYGDQLFPLVAAAELARRLDDVELLPFSPMGVVDTGEEPNAAAWALGPWSEARAAELAARSSLVLCGGGEIVYGDGTLYTPFYGIDRRDAAALGIDKWFIEALGAAEADCPVAWHAPGVPAELDSATALRVRRVAERRAVVGTSQLRRVLRPRNSAAKSWSPWHGLTDTVTICRSAACSSSARARSSARGVIVLLPWTTTTGPSGGSSLA